MFYKLYTYTKNGFIGKETLTHDSKNFDEKDKLYIKSLQNDAR